MTASGGLHRKAKEGDTLLVLRIISAHLLRNFEKHGEMDPQARVEWTTASSGTTREVAATPVHWNAHFSPQWNFTCHGQAYPGPRSGDSLEFKVIEADRICKGTFIGSASLHIDDLWDDVGEATRLAGRGESSRGPLYGPVRELTLKKDHEDTGSIMVQGILVPAHEEPAADAPREPSRVDEGIFESPVQRLAVSGGTAPFFGLRLKRPKSGQSRSHYIGKDLAHAADEVDFYEAALRCGAGGTGEFSDLLECLPEYLGVLRAPEEGQHESRDLLVIHNFKDGLEVPRMVDIKIGQKTGQAGWQGKSRTAAMRQAIVDGMTNSSCEGYRLEGFDNRPGGLASMDPLLDISDLSNSSKVRKKAERAMLQRLSGADVMMHLFDIHTEHLSDEVLHQKMSQSELMELILHETVRRLTRMSVACHASQVPQKWVGSSVALGFDIATLPSRSVKEDDVRKAEEDLRKGVVVAIFDWGRSELNTIERHSRLSDTEQRDRATFWSYYIGGMHRLAWEAARAYRHRFDTGRGWSEVLLTLWDFDSLLPNDFIGRIAVPLQGAIAQRTDDIRNSAGVVTGQLTYSVDRCACPEGSRLRAIWKVRVLRAANLPAFDRAFLRNTVDAFVELVGVSREDHRAFRQVSRVKPRTKCPEWDETFELPEPARPELFLEALEDVLPAGSSESLDSMFPMEKHLYHIVGGHHAIHAHHETSTKASGYWRKPSLLRQHGSEGASDEGHALKQWINLLDDAAHLKAGATWNALVCSCEGRYSKRAHGSSSSLDRVDEHKHSAPDRHESGPDSYSQKAAGPVHDAAADATLGSSPSRSQPSSGGFSSNAAECGGHGTSDAVALPAPTPPRLPSPPPPPPEERAIRRTSTARSILAPASVGPTKLDCRDRRQYSVHL